MENLCIYTAIAVQWQGFFQKSSLHAPKAGCRLLFHGKNYSISGAKTKPSNTESAIASSPGRKNGWLNT